MSKETYMCQKRHTCVKRDLDMSKKTSICHKSISCRHDLKPFLHCVSVSQVCQKRPICVKKRLVNVKRDANFTNPYLAATIPSRSSTVWVCHSCVRRTYMCQKETYICQKRLHVVRMNERHVQGGKDPQDALSCRSFSQKSH